MYIDSNYDLEVKSASLSRNSVGGGRTYPVIRLVVCEPGGRNYTYTLNVRAIHDLGRVRDFLANITLDFSLRDDDEAVEQFQAELLNIINPQQAAA